MKERWQKLADTIDAMAFRERMLILLSLIAVLFLIVDALSYQPAMARQQKLKESIDNLQLQFNVLEYEAKGIQDDATENPVSLREDRIAELSAEEDRLNSRIQTQLGLVMDPREATRILKGILRQDPTVSLVGLKTRVSDFIDDLPGQRTAESDPVTGINRYEMTLQLEGEYLAILAFLEKIEALPWTLFWEQLELNVTQHPIAAVTVRIYTLGSYGDAS